MSVVLTADMATVGHFQGHSGLSGGPGMLVCLALPCSFWKVEGRPACSLPTPPTPPQTHQGLPLALHLAFAEDSRAPPLQTNAQF